eukprot:TRINITY_DN19459_c0_g1_i1.p1 TRINITY_DN19459_c0_g1~~TRINITY_DN19459_c0_g1_i1.p1  ORF type:complete len:666 (+),score=106.10 TRINITY_DN19459_c0_g1_i1:89-2086(+)
MELPESDVGSDFIVDDDGASAAFESCRGSVEAGPSKALVPAVVRQLLTHRRSLDDSARGSLGPNAEAWTARLRDFAAVAQRIRATSASGKVSAQRQHYNNRGLEARTFLNLQAYDIDDVAVKPKNTPGSTQLMYMFYSRIYDKLVGKQRGVEVPLFQSIDLSARLMGFREILDWATDFRLLPSRVGRRELERVFASVQPADPSQSPRKLLEGKITFHEFVDLLALCADAGEPMDRSKIDGSRVRDTETRLERVRRLATFLSLANVTKVRQALHNAYRDVHFWKLSDGADFEKEARVAEVRARPQRRVDLVHEARRIDPERDAAALKFLQQFTWVPSDLIWEEFEIPILDMGVSVVGGKNHRFKVTLQNCRPAVAKVSLRAEDCGPMKLPWRDMSLSPGQTVDILVEVVPLECGEWCGRLVASAVYPNSMPEETVIPTYSRIVHPHGSGVSLVDQLPQHAPRAFRPGSCRRVTVNPASNSSRQLWPRPPTAGGSSRPASASTAPSPPAVSPACLATALPPSRRTPSPGPGALPPPLPLPRPGERSTVPGGRGPAGIRAMPGRPAGAAAAAHGRTGVSPQRWRPSRPHSAPAPPVPRVAQNGSVASSCAGPLADVAAAALAPPISGASLGSAGSLRGRHASDSGRPRSASARRPQSATVLRHASFGD